MKNAEHQQYLSLLKDYRPSIADFMLRCERKQVVPDDRATMLRCAHSLIDSSEVNGYPGIGKAAQALQEALTAQATNDALIPLAHALYAACHEALVFLPSAALVKMQPSPLPSDKLARKPTLLTADDDRAVRAMIEAIFIHDAHVITAEDGLSALEAIKRHKPDLVLLDDTMPGMTGLKLLEKLREDPKLSSTCVIMLTSSDRQQDLTRAFKAGALDYIAKPFDPQALATKIRAVLKTFDK